MNRLVDMIMAEGSLSWRLLQHINSAFFNLPEKVTSIKGAILFLGLFEALALPLWLIVAGYRSGNSPIEGS